jgi:hypothetical protein
MQPEIREAGAFEQRSDLVWSPRTSLTHRHEIEAEIGGADGLGAIGSPIRIVPPGTSAERATRRIRIAASSSWSCRTRTRVTRSTPAGTGPVRKSPP